ncbi:MAG: hypothetical protein BJ554DRAFT_2349, partial [Olpidium bornovanus]
FFFFFFFSLFHVKLVRRIREAVALDVILVVIIVRQGDRLDSNHPVGQQQFFAELPVSARPGDGKLQVLLGDRIPVLVDHENGQEVERAAEEKPVHVVVRARAYWPRREHHASEGNRKKR